MEEIRITKWKLLLGLFLIFLAGFYLGLALR